MPASVTVVVVHGTFDRAALWAQRGSLLNNSLADALPADAEIIVYSWSARNSIRARDEAVAGLTRLVQSTVAADGSTRIFLVAHSHGGTIALQAVANADIGDQCAGIACLATPFLQFLPRDLGNAALLSAAAAAFALPIGLASLIFYLALLPWFSAKGYYGETVGLYYIVVLSAFTLYVNFCSNVQRGWSDRATTLVRPAVAIAPDSLLLLRASADEASAVLGMTAAISILATKVWTSLQSMVDQVITWVHIPTSLAFASIVRFGNVVDWMDAVIARRTGRDEQGCGCMLMLAGLWTLFIPLVLMVFGIDFFGKQSGVRRVIFDALVYLPFYVIVMCLAVVAVLIGSYLILSFARLPIIALLALVQWVTVDRETALMTLLVDVYADGTPPGVWTVHLLPQATATDLASPKQNRPLYRHTRICYDKRAIALVSEWMAKRWHAIEC